MSVCLNKHTQLLYTYYDFVYNPFILCMFVCMNVTLLCIKQVFSIVCIDSSYTS